MRMLIDEARVRLDVHVQQSKIELADSTAWTVSEFVDGWLFVASTPGVLGGRYFVVMDDGAVHHEVGSLPPQWFVAKYSRDGEDVSIKVIVDERKPFR